MYSGDTVFEVCQIDTDVYADELDSTTSTALQQMCHSLACLQIKSFPNKWTNAVIRKLTRIGVNTPTDLAMKITNLTLNRQLKDLGESGFNPTSLRGFMILINGNQDFRPEDLRSQDFHLGGN